MNKLLMGVIRPALSAAIFAGAGPQLEAGYAASPVQPQPHTFAPNCAARPKCLTNVCLRSGRCSFGNHIQPSGCLLYTCKHGAR
jgi:hypothetical protein